MKARVKATGEIVEIMQVYEKGESFYVRLDMLDTTEVRYHISELEFEGFEIPTSSKNEGSVVYIDPTIDYWTKLEHQYAGMVMQGLCANYTEFTKDNDGTLSNTEMITENARIIAHALVEKLKEKEERK